GLLGIEGFHRRILLMNHRLGRLFVLFFDALRANPHVVEEAAQYRRTHGQQGQGFGDAFPQADHRADGRLVRQARVQRRLVGVVQHVHHVGAADTIGVVETGVLIAARLQVLDAFLGVALHVVLAAEHDGTGRAGLHAGRLHAHRYAVAAQGALVGLLVLLGDARHVERAAGDAIAAADALVLVEVDDAVGVLHDGARARACREAAWLGAMHAAVLADQPFQITVGLFVLGEAHHRPAFGGQVDRVVVGAVVAAHLVTQLVPFRAGDLAGLAADALGHVDQLGHLLDLTDRGSGRGGCGARNDVLSSHYTFSTLTRNDFDSGVWVLPSPMKGTMVLAMYPGLATPVKPQCSGMPIWCTTCPLTCNGRMRLVTTATASRKPRLELTRTRSPATMPFSLASTSPISTNCSG